jgi:hypothetical protein
LNSSKTISIKSLTRHNRKRPRNLLTPTRGAAILRETATNHTGLSRHRTFQLEIVVPLA